MLGASAKWSDDDLRKLKRAFLEIDYNKKEIINEQYVYQDYEGRVEKSEFAYVVDKINGRLTG